MSFRDVPVSVLDRANALAGVDQTDVLRGVIDRARRVEGLGFKRFWVAEHHGVPGIVGATPTVLMAAIAAETQKIRIGSGGVMLPNHAPLIVAEQAATLEALHPGRIDLGLGRSVGFTPAVREALRSERGAALRFGEDLRELMAFLNGTAPFTARPRNDAATPLFVLATGQGLVTAAELGLAVVVGGPSVVHREGDSHPGLAAYRRDFQPSPWWPEPYVIVSADVAVADSADDAERLVLPEAWSLAQSSTRGEFSPLESADEVAAKVARATDRERTRTQEHLDAALAGTPDEVAAGVQELLSYTGADEVLITGGMSDIAGQQRSDELAAEIFGRG
ncbi:MsnO8 family LLM class oxidoreductase [Parenemella sanctibonifatiensis]|uniref:LLM class flavin-dependent oxidoreductase n=1 Tax=Parenemella sanctibonifatiensis TaxID=2016505 RepID=A0A255ECT8_9ACTN|nr:MsnO8 family LLM class oxidoreductase [Parenemella sanctibonifatiensis]OYN89080.1 LLM class flavin-dependent oxidoreductase [Parenemella sanctibonifatiensis]